jgi:hypothetical protein
MKTTMQTLGFSLLLALTTVASADYFDGETPLLCSLHQLHECDPPNGCQSVTPAEVSGFSHLEIDFEAKEVTRPDEDDGQKSVIENIETRVDGKLIIQGIEDGSPEERDGAGWSISIMNPEGTMSMAVAGDGFVIVGLGACVPMP